MNPFDAAAVSADALLAEHITIVGYGSQGRAQALNLRDSGAKVTIAARRGPSWDVATADGFSPVAVKDAVESATLVQLLVPDHVQPSLYRAEVAPRLRPGQLLMFSHGFNVHYGHIRPPEGVDVAMVAPKAPGPSVRAAYLNGGGVPALVATARDASGRATARALAYANGLGCGRAAIYMTSFQEETETDLFGEQAVLCGGVAALMRAGFDTLVQAGYSPHIAYFECVHELKLIVDLIHSSGLSGMHSAVSDTAAYGSYTRGRRIIDGRTRANMRALLREIQTGSFAHEWLAENEAGRPRLEALAREERALVLEQVGAELRQRMSGGLS